MLVSAEKLDAETLKLNFPNIRKELHEIWQPILENYNRKFSEQQIEITFREPMDVLQIISRKLSLLSEETTDGIGNGELFQLSAQLDELNSSLRQKELQVNQLENRLKLSDFPSLWDKNHGTVMRDLQRLKTSIVELKDGLMDF